MDLKCSKLKYINISFNKLENIDEILESCPDLIHLNVSHNLLHSLKVKSNKLEYLDISFNNFKVLDEMIQENSFTDSLVYLNVKGNPLEPNQSSKLEGLHKIEFFNDKSLQMVVKTLNFEHNSVVDDDKIYENSKFAQDIQVDKEKGSLSL